MNPYKYFFLFQTDKLIRWAVIGVLAGLITFVVLRIRENKRKAGTKVFWCSLFASYCSLILSLTLFGRESAESALYNLKPFWSYIAIWNGTENLWHEILSNIILFIPLGVFLRALFSFSTRKALVVGFSISVGVELLQLITHRGLFELDDIFHNLFGAFMGAMTYQVFAVCTQRKGRSKDLCCSQKEESE